MFHTIVDTIGNTPLVKINGLSEEYADLYVKIESRNPSGSVKDRPALYIVKELMAQGILSEGGTIIEQSSGNTGIALSMIGAASGLDVKIIMPDTMTAERRAIIKAYGAELILTPGAEGMQGAKNKAEALSKELDAPIFGQFSNFANVKSHEETTAQEILKDLPDVDAFVAGIGTGGTVTGVGKVLKANNPETIIWAVEPKDSPLLSQGKAGSHKIQGLGANFIPEIYSNDNVDEYFLVANEEAQEATRKLARTQGILAGVSSGANYFAALALAKKLGKGKKVVTVLPDTGERYLSSGIFDA